jgi:hypothetical protein
LVAFRYDFTNAGFSIDACRFCKRFWDFIALFSTVLFASNTLIILFIIGGLTAVIAQFTKLLKCEAKISLFHHCPNGFHDYAVWFGFFQCGRRSLTTSWVL